MKIGSFYKDNIYIISQTNHGSNQAFMALDFGYLGYADKNFYAPFDLIFKRSWSKDYNGGCEYWLKGCPDSYIQIVHWTPASSKSYIKGEKMGLVVGDHVHITLNIKGLWQVYLDYADRSGELYFWQFGQKHFKWTNWDTYTDKQLICYNEAMQKISQLPYLLKCTSTNTSTFNIRAEANSKSLDIGDVPINFSWFTNVIAIGESVNGNDKWYQIRVPSGEYEGVAGYCSGAWVKEEKVESDCSECETKLALAKVENERLRTDLAEANDELGKYQQIIFYTKQP